MTSMELTRREEIRSPKRTQRYLDFQNEPEAISAKYLEGAEEIVVLRLREANRLRRMFRAMLKFHKLRLGELQKVTPEIPGRMISITDILGRTMKTPREAKSRWTR